jgi:hypothetical protein
MRAVSLAAAVITALCATPHPMQAQAHQHVPGMTHPTAPDTLSARLPASQAAFATIAEVVRILDADSSTDWSRVNIERLRQHLIDMDEVVMRAQVTASDTKGGARYVVRGGPRTAAAIKRMLTAHATMLGAEAITATVSTQPDGVVLTALATNASDTHAVMRIRALGMTGLLTLGEHHSAHHLALARGDAMPGH